VGWFEWENVNAMKKLIFVSATLLFVALMTSCVTSKTIQNEKALEEWLSTATMPVTVQNQGQANFCRPSFNCYTLIDAKGRIHSARNVRYALPRMIPEDTTRLQRPLLEQIFGSNRTR
jgi:hypothetical protein